MKHKNTKKKLSLNKLLGVFVAALSGLGLGSLMNTDRLAAQSLHNQIRMLSSNLQLQQLATQKAQQESKDQRTENQSKLLTTCTGIAKNAVNKTS